MLPLVPPSPDYTRSASSPRRGYAAIREEESDDLTRSTASSKLFPIQTGETSPLVLVHKEATRELEKQYLDRYLRDIEGQKEALKSQWKEEQTEQGEKKVSGIGDWCTKLEVFLANMPLTIGAVGLSWVTLGVVWFKFMEENIDSCTPAHFYSDKCTFPEFPGCFACIETDPIYKIAISWHYFCHCVAGLCCALFLLKVITGGPLVVEELRNPATSTPMGVVCITIVCVFAGRFGWIGETIVLVTSTAHVLLAFWFLYHAVVVYRLYPDPGWFPNTVGISYAAVKTWLYHPAAGHFLLVLCFIFFINLYGITLFRVARNEKIALPVCFIQLSAPSITLYAITLWAQTMPGQDHILNADPARLEVFVELHRRYYLPVQHIMLGLSLIGMVSVLHALYVRWDNFMRKEFSPAHAALVFPILSHTNAIQAYRSGVDSFSTMGSFFKIALFSYWFVCLIGGTLLCLIFTWHYVIRLPKWTNLSDEESVDDDAISVDPSWFGSNFEQSSQSSVLTDNWNFGRQDWELLDDIEDAVNPAVMEANEAGALVRVRRGTADFERFGPYKRTRRVSSVGFDPVLTTTELQTERARHRHRRTMSIPNASAIAGGSRRLSNHQRSRTLA
jgi:hypothetical protein